MKTFLLLLVASLSSCALMAQAPVDLPKTPTTHVLAIGHLTVPRSQVLPLLPKEVRETVELYLGGKLEQWYSRNDVDGVVFLMQVTSVEEARRLLEAMPLGKAKLLQFEYIPLGPLAPLNALLRNGPPAK